VWRPLVVLAAGVALAGLRFHPVFAQTSEPVGDRVAAAAHRSRALELGYNLDRDEALVAFEEAIAADPTDPVSYRLAAATVWTQIVFEQGAISVEDYLGQANARHRRHAPRPELAAKFKTYIQRSLALSEERLRANPNADAYYQVGAAYGCLASYTATVEGRVRESLGPARRAYKAHQRVLSLDPRRKDAALIVGMTRHAVASLSAPLRFIAYLAGFDGDGDRGIRYVEEAAQYPGETSRNALFTLVLLYNREGRYDDALQLIEELQQRYPRNRLLWLEEGNTLLRAGRADAARVAIEEGLDRLARDTRPRAPGEESRWETALASTRGHK
jgi:tetratricopeptide (TPR) repeat protein